MTIIWSNYDKQMMKQQLLLKRIALKINLKLNLILSQYSLNQLLKEIETLSMEIER